MANLGRMLRQLRGEHSRVQKGLDRLDEAIAVFEKLVTPNPGQGAHRGPRGAVRIGASGLDLRVERNAAKLGGADYGQSRSQAESEAFDVMYRIVYIVN